MRFCAVRHLVDEIELVQPRAICFLGVTNAGPAAESVFQRLIGEAPERAEIRRPDGTRGWEGWTSVTVQPVRGTKEDGRNRERVAKVIERLRDLVTADDVTMARTPDDERSQTKDA